MCDEIVINVCLFIYLSNISVFLDKSCIYLYLYSKMKKIPVLLFHISVAHAFLFLWRTTFCGALGTVRHRIPLHRGPAELFLWRITLGAPQKFELSVAHSPVRHRNNFCGENSVAHQENLVVRHRIGIWCATNNHFCTSACKMHI